MMATIVGIIVLVLGGGAWLFLGGVAEAEDSIKVASFNAEIFGDAKISNVGVDYYVDLVSDYDLFFLLEIRDVDNSSFEELCGALVGYECYLSARSGRTISKEAVGVFVKNDLNVSRFGEYEDDTIPSVFERAPVWIDVSLSPRDNSGEPVRYWAVHLNHDDVYREMEALEILVGENIVARNSVPSNLGTDVPFSSGKTIVLGDMNADCDYYSSGVDFDGWNWVIGDDADTASGFKDCAYDRIIVSSGVEVLGSGVVPIDSLVSDHNLVFVEVAR